VNREENKMSRNFFFVLSFLLAAMVAACVTNPEVERGSVSLENRDMKAVLIFSDHDREKINHYFKSRSKTKKMPPGLAKKEELPPGLQKHIQKYNELPPGLEGRRLPGELDRNLTRLPEGYIRLKIGSDVVLMNEITRVVFDVILGVD
jgi:Ni/Co efflux regulator RcnB